MWQRPAAAGGGVAGCVTAGADAVRRNTEVVNLRRRQGMYGTLSLILLHFCRLGTLLHTRSRYRFDGGGIMPD